MDEELDPGTPLPQPDGTPDVTQPESDATPPDDHAQSDAPEPSPEPDPDIEAMLAEAEQRGYLRGCNEQIETLMQQPDLWHGTPAGSAARTDDDEPQILILNHIRPSVWDE